MRSAALMTELGELHFKLHIHKEPVSPEATLIFTEAFRVVRSL